MVETLGKDGYEAFDALRQKYQSEPWYKDVHGDFLFAVLPLDKAQIDAMAKEFGVDTTPFHYEPMPTLRASTTPQLWVLGSDDLEAPSAETAKRIRALIAEGRPYTLAVYPGAEHGMTLYELNDKGERALDPVCAGLFPDDGRLHPQRANRQALRRCGDRPAQDPLTTCQCAAERPRSSISSIIRRSWSRKRHHARSRR